MTLCLLPAAGWAQINVTQTGLYSDAHVYGVEAPLGTVPFVNPDNILVWAEGATDPALYWNVSFSAYGIFSGVPTVNSGSIGVTAVGGAGGAGPSTDLLAYVRGYGLYADGWTDNSGDIALSMTGGTLNTDSGNDSYAEALADAFGWGLNATGAVHNDASVDVVVQGGQAGTETVASQYAGPYTTVRAAVYVQGLHAGNNVENEGNITVTATGGDANTRGHAGNHASLYADAQADGIQVVTDVHNTGEIIVSATGGTADADGTTGWYAHASAGAQAAGISAGGVIQNDNDITTTATGGRAISTGYASSSALAEAEGYGIRASTSVNNTGRIVGTAAGGYAQASADSQESYPMADAEVQGKIYGIYIGYGDVNNAGDILVTAIGGRGEVSAAADNYSWAKNGATAFAAGIFYTGDRISDLVANTGSIAATAAGGNAEADSRGYEVEVRTDALSSGIRTYGRVYNADHITATATGGHADANGVAADVAWAKAYAPAQAYGISTRGDVNNVADVSVTSTGGVADARAQGGEAYVDAHADAQAWGIQAQEAGIRNSGDVTIDVTGGEADGHGVARIATTADTEAYGMKAAGQIDNPGTVTIRARAGTAAADGYTELSAGARSDAYGIKGDADVNNSGLIMMEVFGGTAMSSDAANAGAGVQTDVGVYAAGIWAKGDVRNDGTVAVTAVKGTDGAGGEAQARGIYAQGTIDNNHLITATAQGGTVSDSNSATAVGIAAVNGKVNNRSGITSLASGGGAHAYGISGAGSDVNNTGDITVTAAVGAADANNADSIGASGYAYGVHLLGARVENTGTITVRAEGGTADANDIGGSKIAASAEAYGVHSEGPVANKGMIEVAATGGDAGAHMTDAYADAWGIYSKYGLITNEAQVTATAKGGHLVSASTDPNDKTDATGGAHGVYSGYGAIDNRGAVLASATGGRVVSSIAGDPHEILASAWAYGLSYGGEANIDQYVTNTGQITAEAIGGSVRTGSDRVDASARAYGISSTGAAVRNSDHLTAVATGGTAASSSTSTQNTRAIDASARAYGIDSARNTVENTGYIVASATGGTASGQGSANTCADAEAYGIRGGGMGLSSQGTEIRNTGQILALARGGTAEGGTSSTVAYAAGLSADRIDVNNAGLITASAISTGGFASQAYGIRAQGRDGGANGIHNRDDIMASAQGGPAVAIGLWADTIDVNNSGEITVVATAGAGFASEAYGIQLTGNNSLTNTGIIRASADNAYEVRISGGTITLIDTYNVTLDGDPNQASIGVDNASTLVLNRAKLTVTGIDGETRWDTKYKLFRTEGTGAVTDAFGLVQAKNPNAAVLYDNQRTSDCADDTVALTYAPGGSVALPSATVDRQVVLWAMDMVNRHMTAQMLSRVLSPSQGTLTAQVGPTCYSIVPGEAAGDLSNGIFVEPYFSRLDHEADPMGYEARLWGFSAGYERHVENTLLGLHFGYGRADINYTGTGYDADQDDQDTVTGGIAGVTRWDAWVVRYGITGFYGWHTYQGLTGLSLQDHETASYDSYGATATAMTGPVLRYGSHAFLPEVGATWLWAHRNRYTTEATDPRWNTTFSAMDDHDIYAQASVRWLGSMLLGNIHVLPTASIGLRYLLIGADVGVVQSIPGAAPVLVESRQDRRALTLSGGVALTKARHTVSVAYDGEFSSDAQRDSVWLRYGWQF